MEFYAMITESCSLRCNYCYRHRQNYKKSKLSYTPEDLISFVERTERQFQPNKHRELQEAQVVFYGGEPTNTCQSIDFMETCMLYPADVSIRFALQTNGTRLNVVPWWIMDRFNTVLVSIDGFEEITDRNRGQGVYKRIIHNLDYIPPKLRENTIARITLTVDRINSIFRSIMDLSPHFEAIYWQVQSMEGLPQDFETFETQYRVDIKKLLKYWVEQMREGRMKKLIPFMALAYPIIAGVKYRGLRCACGRELVYIRPDGICFPCAELTWNDNLVIGDIWSGISYEKMEKYLHNLKLTCAICRHRDICGGRCLSCFLRPEAPFDFYCELTKFIINQVYRVIPEIERLLKKEIIKEEDLNPDIVRYTEEIP